MKRLMLAHAFQYVERVLFFVGEGNGRSRRAMENIGGVLTTRTHETEMAGKPVRHVIYVIERTSGRDDRRYYFFIPFHTAPISIPRTALCSTSLGRSNHVRGKGCAHDSDS